MQAKMQQKSGQGKAGSHNIYNRNTNMCEREINKCAPLRYAYTAPAPGYVTVHVGGYSREVPHTLHCPPPPSPSRPHAFLRLDRRHCVQKISKTNGLASQIS